LHTYLLSDEEIRRYGLDFLSRLELLGSSAPQLWCTLGISGDKIAAFLISISGSSPAIPSQWVRLGFDRKKQEIIFRDKKSLPDTLGEEPILLIDAAVHSGKSMSRAVDALYLRGAKNIISYSLVVKRTSDFIPNFFAIAMDEHDRVFFQLEKVPNNRLRQAAPFGTLRALREEDIRRVPDRLNTGVPSIDKTTFADLWYYAKTQSSTVYIYEIAGRIVAFLHFKHQAGGRLFLDLVAADLDFQGYRIGSLLMRWAETFARTSKCVAIDLWAIESRVSWYENRGYEVLGVPPMNLGEGESYIKMSRPILYNIKPLELADVIA